MPTDDELARLYSSATDSEIADAFATGPGAFSGAAWSIIAGEAANRAIDQPERSGPVLESLGSSTAGAPLVVSEEIRDDVRRGHAHVNWFGSATVLGIILSPVFGGNAGSIMVGPLLIVIALTFFSNRGAGWARRVLAVYAAFLLLGFGGGAILGSRGNGMQSILLAGGVLAGLFGVHRLWVSHDIAAFEASRKISARTG